MIELSVKVSNSEQSYTHKFLVYEALTLSEDSPMLADYVSQARACFKGEVDDVRISAKMEI
jgi:hypothetical protein